MVFGRTREINPLHRAREPINFDYGDMVSDECRRWGLTAGRGGMPLTGSGLITGPFEMESILDFTGLRGSGSNIYNALVHQIPKWDYKMVKVDEWLEVSPVWAEFYNLTIGQKQKLEATIKQGLTSAAQSVADFELLKHDMRRYREILDYFVHSKKTGDEHVLRSLFVDRVDAHTGDAYSMIGMAKRWPTIITDFIRMKSDWNDIDLIRKNLDVTSAEATVLLTKNQLYREWKLLFLPTIKDRVARIEVLVESRRRSIDEYRSWLKPYMARFKQFRERTENKPSTFVSDAYYAPGFGQSRAETGVRIWCWSPFSPAEKGRAENVRNKGKRGFIIDPYDDIVRTWQKKIEKRYDVTITEKDVDDIIEEAKKGSKPNIGTPGLGVPPAMDPNYIYYVFWDMNIQLSLIRTPPPEGSETDNLMFLPMKVYVLSHNILLIHLMEIWAKEKNFENNLNRLIGTREAEEDALARIEQEFDVSKRGKKMKKKTHDVLGTWRRKVKPPLVKFAHVFIRPGPYEPVYTERVSKMYSRGIGFQYGQMVDYLLKKMQVD